MAGAGIKIDFEARGLERLRERLNRLAELPNQRGLWEAVGAEVESQTRRRILNEKRSPEGEPWQPWTESYAATRHGGHSRLVGEGDLESSIQFLVTGDQVEVGTNLIYGAIHQFGGEEVGIPIPARPYLGIGAENADDLLAILDDWAEQQLR